MSVGHLVHVLLTVYNATEHVTQKSPGPIWFIAVPPWRPLPHCPSRWHGSLPWHGHWWQTCEVEVVKRQAQR